MDKCLTIKCEVYQNLLTPTTIFVLHSFTAFSLQKDRCVFSYNTSYFVVHIEKCCVVLFHVDYINSWATVWTIVINGS